MAEQNQDQKKEEEIKYSWKDVLAMTIAAYEVLLGPLLLIFLAVGGLVLLFYLIFG